MKITRDEFAELCGLDLRFSLGGEAFTDEALSTRASSWVADLGAVQWLLHAQLGATRGRDAWTQLRTSFAEDACRGRLPRGVQRWGALVRELAIPGTHQHAEIEVVVRAFERYVEVRELLDELLSSIFGVAPPRRRGAWFRAVVRGGTHDNFYHLLAALAGGDRQIASDVELLDEQLGHYADLGVRKIMAAIIHRRAIAEAEDAAGSVNVKGLPITRLVRAWLMLRPDDEMSMDAWLALLRDELESVVDAVAAGQHFPPVTRFAIGEGRIDALQDGPVLLQDAKSHRRVDQLFHAERDDVPDARLQLLRNRSLLGLDVVGTRISMALAYTLRRLRDSFAHRVMPSLKTFGLFAQLVRPWAQARNAVSERPIPQLVIGPPELPKDDWVGRPWHVWDHRRQCSAASIFALVCAVLVDLPDSLGPMEAWFSVRLGISREAALALKRHPELRVLAAGRHTRLERLRALWVGGLHARLTEFATAFRESPAGRNALVRERGLRPPLDADAIAVRRVPAWIDVIADRPSGQPWLTFEDAQSRDAFLDRLATRLEWIDEPTLDALITAIHGASSDARGVGGVEHVTRERLLMLATDW